MGLLAIATLLIVLPTARMESRILTASPGPFVPPRSTAS
jgi:hypothetical protein